MSMRDDSDIVDFYVDDLDLAYLLEDINDNYPGEMDKMFCIQQIINSQFYRTSKYNIY